MTWHTKPAPKPRVKPKKRVKLKRCGKRTAKSGGQLFYKSGRNPAYLAWLRSQRCVVCAKIRKHQTTYTVAAHIKSRATGGPDLGNAIALCWHHHDLQGLWGWKYFEKRTGISGADEAAKATLRFLETGGKAA